MKLVATLGLIQKNGKILLAMKKRGHGQGWWNGYGGKVLEDEDPEAAMVRELLEESGLEALRLHKRGFLEFVFKGSDLIIETHLFAIVDYSGELIETEEMRPKWFPKDKLPFEDMWPADRQWMPDFIEGKNISGKVIFNSETKEIIRAKFKNTQEPGLKKLVK